MSQAAYAVIGHKSRSDAMRRFSLLNSLRNKLIAYMGVVFILFMVIVLLANLNYLSFFSEYDKIYEKYNALNRFYKSVNKANDSVKSYFYSTNNDDYVGYKATLEEAARNLKYLKETAFDEDSRWEYTKLSNMLETYAETSGKAMTLKKEGSTVSLESYEKIMKVCDLINNTTVSYFEVIITDMNSARKELQFRWDTQKTVTIFILIGISVFCIGFSLLFMRSINKPIGYLVRNVQKLAKGDYEIPKMHTGSTELNILSDSFHQMASSLGFYVKELQEKSKLQKQLLEQENDNLKMRSLIRETELKALQGQMNPHFLMNTLSIIARMAYIEGATQTSELMEATADLLRYSLEKSSRISDLMSEIESVRNYLFIQKKRYGDRIQFTLEINDDIPNIKMPALVIQPIIENAVMHGVNDMVEGGLIRIKCRRENGYIHINVEDNGNGMESEAIERILLEDSVESDKSTGIGVLNVKKRVEMFFGEKGLFRIDSSPGCGTIVSIRLPLNEELKVSLSV